MMQAGSGIYRWDGEVDDLAVILHRVGASGSYTATTAGKSREFEVPRLADYVDRLRRARVIGAGDAIEDHPHLVAVVQAHWHAAGHNGCLFASLMSDQRARYGWETWVAPQGADAAADATAIRAIVAPRIASPEAQVVSVLLPRVHSPQRLAATLQELARDPAWHLEDYGVEHDVELGRVQRLGLTVDVGKDHWSEVLGFGPGAPLAYTRRAPFTELAIRAKPPAVAEKDRRSYMANMDVDLEKPLFAEYWRETKRQRAARLGDDHALRGKARVTSVVPI